MTTPLFDWTPPGVWKQRHPFATIVPDEVLDEYDGPRIFTFRDRDGATLLAYYCDGIAAFTRFMIVPITPDQLQDIKMGSVPLRQALVAPATVWIADLDDACHPVGVWELTGQELPDEILPPPGLTLFPDSLVTVMEDSVKEPYLHFGTHQDGLQIALRWTGVVTGEILLWLDRVLVWGNPKADRSQPVICDPPYILSFLADAWNRLHYEESMPAGVRYDRQEETRGLLEHLRFQETNRLSHDSVDMSGLMPFLAAHIFSRQWRPELHALSSRTERTDDTLFLLKQGKALLAETSHHRLSLPFDRAMQTFAELGNAICERLRTLETPTNPFATLIQRWEGRSGTNPLEWRVLASGLPLSVVEQVWPKPPANDPEVPEESLCLVARMVGGLETARGDRLKNLLGHLSRVPRGNRLKLSHIQTQLSGVGLLHDGREYRLPDFRAQGLSVARWLRQELKLSNTERVDPQRMLQEWDVPCSEQRSTIPFDAIAVWGRTAGPEIILNPDGPRIKSNAAGRRFTLAHEMAHVLMDMLYYLPYGDVKINSEDGYAFKGPETRANAFAAELLLPEKAVRDWLMNDDESRGKGDSWKNKPAEIKKIIEKIAERYAVGLELVAWKIKHTHLLTRDQESHLSPFLKSITDPY